MNTMEKSIVISIIMSYFRLAASIAIPLSKMKSSQRLAINTIQVAPVAIIVANSRSFLLCRLW